MKSGLFLNVVVRKGPAVLKLFSGENQPLLIGRDTEGDQTMCCHPDSRYLPLFILNLCLNVVDSVRGFYFQGNSLAGQCLDKNLHSSTETENKVKSGFFLNVIVGKSPAIFKLLPRKDKSLLVRRDPESGINFVL